MKSKITATLALLALFQLSNVQAAPIDSELAILAAEQVEEQQTSAEEKVSRPSPKSQKELEAEQKRLREEQRAEEKKLKQEREAARKQIEEGRKEQIDNNEVRKTPRPRQTSTSVNSSIVASEKKNETVTKSAAEPSPSVKESQPTQPEPQAQPVGTASTVPPVNLKNPIETHPTFEDVAKVVGFTPLYLPKKSGYTVTEILSIDRRIAEVRYGRRWEPEVSLQVRTYKRADGEELQDISGVQGAKWRIDTTGGINVYVAKLSDDTHVAAWAVGDYTFSAYMKSVSFAAFHAILLDELVDLSTHYYRG